MNWLMKLFLPLTGALVLAVVMALHLAGLAVDPASAVHRAPDQAELQPGAPAGVRLHASDYQAHDQFGYAVGLEGVRLVVGAPGKNQGGREAGGLYVFEKIGPDWVEVALVPDRLEPNIRLGMAVTLSGDLVVAGAPYASTPAGGFAAGAVYVFEAVDGAWQERAPMIALDGGRFDLYGSAVALDGDTLVVGAPGADDPIHGRNTGVAYVYRRQGGVWVEEARLSAPDGSTEDFFGHALAVHGEVIAVGAFGHDDSEIGPNTGSVYLFQRGDLAWFSQGKLTSSEPAPKAQFGFALDILKNSSETTWLIVGANQYASEPVDPRYTAPPGRVELFLWQDQNWQPVSMVGLPALKEDEAGLWGAAVAVGSLDEDQLFVAMGSLLAPSLHLFRGSGESWESPITLQPEPYQLSFGSALAASGELLAVGSPRDSERLPQGQGFREVSQTGGVYVYDLSGQK